MLQSCVVRLSQTVIGWTVCFPSRVWCLMSTREHSISTELYCYIFSIINNIINNMQQYYRQQCRWSNISMLLISSVIIPVSVSAARWRANHSGDSERRWSRAEQEVCRSVLYIVARLLLLCFIPTLHLLAFYLGWCENLVLLLTFVFF